MNVHHSLSLQQMWFVSPEARWCWEDEITRDPEGHTWKTKVLGVCSSLKRRSHRSARLTRESESVQNDFLTVLNFMIVFHDVMPHFLFCPSVWFVLNFYKTCGLLLETKPDNLSYKRSIYFSHCIKRWEHSVLLPVYLCVCRSSTSREIKAGNESSVFLLRVQ